jgi:hypothetical protein
VHKGVALSIASLFAAFGLAACGSTTSKGTTSVLYAGQVVRSASIVAGASAAGASGASAVASGTTVPLAKQSPATALFSAMGVFQSCLKGHHTTFVGIPNPNTPNSPANNPAYIDALKTCAAQSHILQALKAQQTAQQSLTPKQVKAENVVYLKWRTCLISKGWAVPMPKPNSQGALFSFADTGPQMTPPSGQNVFTSPDIGTCLTLAQHGKT